MTLLRLAALLVGLSAAPALAGTDPVDPPAAAAAAGTPEASGAETPGPETPSIMVKGKSDKKVCRSVVSTGSIMPRRVCKTESELAAETAAAQQTIETLRTDQETAQQIKELRDVH